MAIQAIQELQHEKTRTLNFEEAEVLDEAQTYVSDVTSRFFWYEFTPYEIGCDEIGGGAVHLSQRLNIELTIFQPGSHRGRSAENSTTDAAWSGRSELIRMLNLSSWLM